MIIKIDVAKVFDFLQNGFKNAVMIAAILSIVGILVAALAVVGALFTCHYYVLGALIVFFAIFLLGCGMAAIDRL